MAVKLLFRNQSRDPLPDRPVRRELSQILHLNRKAEIQCIIGSNSASGTGRSNHLDRVLDGIFGEGEPSIEETNDDTQAVRGAAEGLVDYIVQRMREV